MYCVFILRACIVHYRSMYVFIVDINRVDTMMDCYQSTLTINFHSKRLHTVFAIELENYTK